MDDTKKGLIIFLLPFAICLFYVFIETLRECRGKNLFDFFISNLKEILPLYGIIHWHLCAYYIITEFTKPEYQLFVILFFIIWIIVTIRLYYKLKKITKEIQCYQISKSSVIGKSEIEPEVNNKSLKKVEESYSNTEKSTNENQSSSAEPHEFQKQIKCFSVLLEQLQLLAEDKLTNEERKNKFFLSDAVAFSISLILLENKEIDPVKLTQHLISIVLEKEVYECNECELIMFINNRIKDFTKTIENSNYDTVQEFNNSFHEDFKKELRNTPYKRLILDYCNYYALGYVTKRTYSSEDMKSPIKISAHDLYPLKDCVRQTYAALSIIHDNLFVDKRL